MTQYGQTDETANVQLLGAAGVASGIVGGVVAALMHRREVRKEEAAAAATSNASVLMDSVLGSTNESLSRALSQAPQSREEWAAAAQRAREQAAAVATEGQKRSKQLLNDVDVEAISKRARKAVATSRRNSRDATRRKRGLSMATQRRKRLDKGIGSIGVQGLRRKGGHSTSGKTSEFAAGAAALAAAASQHSRGVAGSVKQQSSQVKSRAADAVTDARDVGGQLVGQARDRAPELRNTLEQSVGPRMKDLQDRATPLFSSATTALVSTLESGKGLASETRQIADRDLVPVLKQRVGTAAKSIEHVASHASGTLSGVSGTVDERSRNAAHAASQGTRDTGALAAWSVVAGGLIFYGFMDDEQKAKAKAAGGRIVQEAREIYRDLQGQDESAA